MGMITFLNTNAEKLSFDVPWKDGSKRNMLSGEKLHKDSIDINWQICIPLHEYITLFEDFNIAFECSIRDILDANEVSKKLSNKKKNDLDRQVTKSVTLFKLVHDSPTSLKHLLASNDLLVYICLKYNALIIIPNTNAKANEINCMFTLMML